MALPHVPPRLQALAWHFAAVARLSSAQRQDQKSMCGILGAIGLQLSPQGIRGMIGSLRHRGPDDWGLFFGEPASGAGPGTVFAPPEPASAWQSFDQQSDHPRWREAASARLMLGHTRLSIVDRSRQSHQPFQADNETLVFNGEIYNHVELRETLREHGASFDTPGDTEVLLAAYRQWGDDCVEHLNGCFAFAIWDHRRGELFAARDRLGKKPFYWRQDQPSDLLFASEIKTLWASGQIQPQLDEGVAARYVALGRLPTGAESFFAGIQQLPASSSLRWRPGSSPRITRYWSPRVTFSDQPADAEDVLRSHLTDSLRLRFRADVPVGISLSGGVDSSSLAVASARLGTNRGQESVLTYSAVRGDGDKHDERPEIEAVIEALEGAGAPIESTFFDLSEDATFERFLAFLNLHDEPVRDDGVFHQFLFMRRIRDLGIKVMLSGQGADELFAGYPGYIKPYAKALLQRGRVIAANPWLAEIARRGGTNRAAVVREMLSQLAPGRSIRHKRSRALTWLRASAWDEHCADAFREHLTLGRDWKRYQNSEIFSGSLVSLLKDEDRNSMAHGIETRLPFLDYRLVAWALSLSPTLHFHQGHTKFLLRNAYADTVPERVAFLKRKRGFYVPLFHRFPEHACAMREAIREAHALDSLIDRSAYAQLVKSGRADNLLQWRVFHLAVAWRNACERAGASSWEHHAAAGEA